MTALVKAQSSGMSLAPTNIEQAMRLAEMMARGKLVPSHLQNSPADCLLIIEQANRWGMSPFAVAQCTSSIKGKLMFEGKLVQAAIESSGILSGLFDFRFAGSGPDRTITVSATRAGETTARDVVVALRDAATDNPLWKRQPDQQLVYHGVRVWGRRWCPAVMLGVYSREEIGTPEVDDYVGGPTIDGSAETVQEPEPKRQTVRGFLDALEVDLAAEVDAMGVDAIVARPDVQTALDKLQNGAKERLNAMIAAALARTATDGDDA